MKQKLAKAIIKKRMDKNLSIQQAADEVGVSYFTYWKLENGYNQLSYETTRKIAIFLGITEKEVRDLL